MADVEGLLVDAVAENFDSGGRDESGATGVWPDLQQTTKNRRKLNGDDKYQILVVTGGLRDSAQGFHDRDSAGVGTSKIYATTMHYGAEKGSFGNDKHGRPIPWGDIPARLFMLITDSERSEIIDLLKNYLKGD